MASQDRIVCLDSGTRVHVTDQGSGEALLCLHVLGSTRAEWTMACEPFSQVHRFLAPDLPGFGASDLPSRFWPIREYAAGMFDLLDRLGVRRAHVLGHSFGAVVAAEMAAMAPDRVAGLVLCSPPGGHAETQLRALGSLLAWVRDDGLPRMETLDDARLVTEMATPVFLELANMGLAMARGYLPALAALAGYPYEQRARTITAPTMLVWGSQDRLLPVAEARAWQSWIPGARVEVIDGVGHSLCFEAADPFHRLVLDFLGGLAPA